MIFSRHVQLSLIIIVITLLNSTFSQEVNQLTKELSSRLDFSPLWTKTPNTLVFGFIGDNFQRLRMKIISATKDSEHPDRYRVCGKSKVKNNICRFSGTITIQSIDTLTEMHWGVDDNYKDSGIVKEGSLTAHYYFTEDSTQLHSGIFEGTLSTSWYIDSHGQLRYDNIEIYSDSYCNNQFEGTWKPRNANKAKICNWGDYRILSSRDLDIGAGEFSPDEKYLKYGWQSYQDAWLNENDNARHEEEKEWWK